MVLLTKKRKLVRKISKKKNVKRRCKSLKHRGGVDPNVDPSVDPTYYTVKGQVTKGNVGLYQVPDTGSGSGLYQVSGTGSSYYEVQPREFGPYEEPNLGRYSGEYAMVNPDTYSHLTTGTTGTRESTEYSRLNPNLRNKKGLNKFSKIVNKVIAAQKIFPKPRTRKYYNSKNARLSGLQIISKPSDFYGPKALKH